MFFFKQMDCKEEFKFIYDDDPNFENNEAIQYYMKDSFSKEIPDFKTWPLSKEVYRINYAYVPKVRYNILQPRRNPFKEVNIDFYVSPRKLIRVMEVKGYDFIFCDTFCM